MSTDHIVTLANHHPFHSATFRRHFQHAHDQNVHRHAPSPSPLPEPAPTLTLPALRHADHARPIVTYKGL